VSDEPALPTDPEEQQDAPVITDSGTYGRLPPPPETDLRQFDKRSFALQSSLSWVAMIGFALTAILWLLALSASQMTDPVVALPVQERGIAVITGIDELLEFHADELEANDDGVVKLPGFLVPGVTLTTSEAASGDRDLMRAALLGRAAARVYEEGAGTLHASDAAAIETTMFSTPGGARRVMDLLSASNHDRATKYIRPLAILMIVLGGLAVALGSGFGRFSGLGFAMVGAAGFTFLVALGLKFLVALIGSDGSAVAEEFSQLVNAVAWAPAENAIKFGAAGLIILVPAWLLNWFFDRSTVRERPAADAVDRADIVR
jgi:hypothetical protein